MRFAFAEEHRHVIPVNRLCEIMDVSPRGYRAWRSRPACQSQRKNMVVLAHIREQFALSLGSYGRARMTEELKELGFDVGHRRIGRLMRQNSITVKRNKKLKADHGQQPQLQHRAEPAEPGLPCGCAQPEMGGGHQLCLDPRRLALSGCHPRSTLKARDCLGRQQPDET